MSHVQNKAFITEGKSDSSRLHKSQSKSTKYQLKLFFYLYIDTPWASSTRQK